MKKCSIITYIENGHREILRRLDRESLIICADCGLSYALDAGIMPDLLIGDLDSFQGEIPEGLKVLQVPKEKDDTDTGLCIRHAMENGYMDITLYGGIGGRLDHTLANLQSMKAAKEAGADIRLFALNDEVHIVKNETCTFKNRPGYISVFAADRASGVYERGMAYSLDNATLTSSFPVGVSNQITSECAEVTVEDGLLFVIFSVDK